MLKGQREERREERIEERGERREEREERRKKRGEKREKERESCLSSSKERASLNQMLTKQVLPENASTIK